MQGTMKMPDTGPAKPKTLREVPGYLWALIYGFFDNLFYIIGLVWKTKKSILFVLTILCAVEGVLPIVGAYLQADILNKLGMAIMGQFTDFAPFFLPLALLFAYQFVRRISGNVSTMTTRLAGELVANHIRMEILEKAKTLDLASFDRPSFYEKLENANREAGHRPISILNASFNVISATISAAGFIAVIAMLHPVAPLLIFAMALPGAIINYIYRTKMFRYMRHRSKERRQMEYYAAVVTNKDLAKEMQLLDLPDTFIGKYKSVFARYFAGIRRLIVQESFFHMGVSFLAVLVNAGVFFYVVLCVSRGEMNLGDYSLYTGALTSITTHVNTLVSATATIYEGTLFIENMRLFMRERASIVPSLPTPAVPHRGRHTIELRHVSFSYPGTDRYVLQDISLTLRSGETTVLVGLNGAGKTTLIKLITRLYDPTEGVILLDGKDIRTYDVKELHRLYGIIFQDFGKYAVSVRENIAFGDIQRAPVEEEIRAAAEAGAASDFIERLPEGYDTPLMRFFEENGIELSIGQWQKLSIARAFYKDSDILILDEPTASLDPLAEQEVFDQFSRLGKDKVTVFVSHRLSSATTADQIVVLEYGKIIECGDHTTLMRAKDRYFELFSTQARRYTENEKEP